MKKGVSGVVLGVLFFVIAGNLIFRVGSSVFSAIPAFVFIFIIGGILSFFKKAYNDQKNNNKTTYKDNGFTQKESQFDSIDKSKYDLGSEYKGNSSVRENQDPYKDSRSHFSKRCKKCNSLIQNDDRYCPECGASQKDTIICEYCGHENPASNALCEKCNGFL